MERHHKEGFEKENVRLGQLCGFEGVIMYL